MAKSKLKLLYVASVFLFAACGQTSYESDNRQPVDKIMDINKLPMADDGIVRLSKIQVYPEHLDNYLKYAVEVGEISLQTEPGVLAMYAMQDMADSCSITILESYSSQDAYKKHIASEHFQRYKQGTIHMVKSLELCDQRTLNPDSRITNLISNQSDYKDDKQ